MKKKRRIIAALAAALVMASGCQKKYEPVVLGSEGQVRTTETGGASDAGQESGQTGIDPGRDLSGDPAGQGKEPLAQTSVKEQNMVGEPVPALRDVDETVYVNGDSVNLRASASTASKVVSRRVTEQDTPSISSPRPQPPSW